jgi:hypothetical protein
MSLLDDILPTQRYDETPVTNACRSLLQALTSPGAKEQPRLTVELGPDEWRALEAQFRRPFRPHASSKLLPVEGVGWVEFRRAKAADVPPLVAYGPCLMPDVCAQLPSGCRCTPTARPDALGEYAAARGWRMIGPSPAVASAPIATMDPAFRQQPALTPEADQAIASARVERAAWTPDAVLAKGAVPAVPAMGPVIHSPSGDFRFSLGPTGGLVAHRAEDYPVDADGGVWKGDGK